MNQDFASRMGEFERDMEASMSHMQENMNQAFGNNFPFGNSNPFGNNFPFGNANPFNNQQPFVNNFNPLANFRTFFYSPPINYENNNFNGIVTGYANYPTYSPSVSSIPNPNNVEPKESEFSVEEFKPVYHHPLNSYYQTTPSVNNNYYGRYAYK